VCGSGSIFSRGHKHIDKPEFYDGLLNAKPSHSFLGQMGGGCAVRGKLSDKESHAAWPCAASRPEKLESRLGKHATESIL